MLDEVESGSSILPEWEPFDNVEEEDLPTCPACKGRGVDRWDGDCETCGGDGVLYR